MRKLFYLFLLFLVACKPGVDEYPNRFHDEILRQIYTLQDNRKTQELLPFFQNEKAQYREAAALAFASIQDSSVAENLAALLSDEDKGVRTASAYAIGQCQHKGSTNTLIEAYQNETSIKVKKQLLESIGKCKTKAALDFLVELKIDNNDSNLIEGQIIGITNAGFYRIISEKGNSIAIKYVQAENPYNVRYAASNYLGFIKPIDLSSYDTQLIEIYKNETDINILINIAKSMGRALTPLIMEQLIDIVNSSADYRIRVNSIRALGYFNYDDVAKVVLALLDDENRNVSVTASEFFIRYGKASDGNLYFAKAKTIECTRTRANVLLASMQSEMLNKDELSSYIISLYDASKSNHEKAWLLKALGAYPANFDFIAAETFSKNDFVIKTVGIEALLDIKRCEDYDDSRTKELIALLEKAILAGDAGLTSMAANLIHDPSLKLKNDFKNIDLLYDAINKFCKPGNIDAFTDINACIKSLGGKKVTIPEHQHTPINWELITTIPSDQEVIVSTEKGDFTIQLDVNNSPATVSLFLRLIKEGFYNNLRIHRVVANFVVQDGCSRGDGWGGCDYDLHSEFLPSHFTEGSLGMASSGKDTEGSQWFVLHSPSPHLDGKYTHFGSVVKGLEVVHTLEVGDSIYGITVIGSKE